jgi:hypothetical protein
MFMRIACAVLLCHAVIGCSGLAQDSKQEDATSTCTFEDGAEISVRYIPVASNKEKIQNGKIWAPGGSPITLFTPVALLLDKSQIPAGAFSLYLVPQKDRWTLVVNKNVSAGSKYDERQDLARSSMEMGELGEPATTLELSFGRMGPKHCSLRVYFGKTGGWAEFFEK